MANHKSAIKRARQNQKRHLRNLGLKTSMRSAVKKAMEGIQKAGSRDEAVKALAAGEKALAKAASKGVIPRERASRKTARLAASINARFQAASAR